MFIRPPATEIAVFRVGQDTDVILTEMPVAELTGVELDMPTTMP
jgi:hypothetical protein